MSEYPLQISSPPKRKPNLFSFQDDEGFKTLKTCHNVINHNRHQVKQKGIKIYHMRNLFLIFILLLIACTKKEEAKAQKPVPEGRVPCEVVRVVDGDTFHCLLEGKEEVKVRLIGVDTPESSENQKAVRDAQRSGRDVREIVRMGKKSAEFTKSLLPKGSTVYLEFDVQKTDKYGRLLAYVWLSDGRMLNELLVREGYAQVYTIPPNVKYQERFLEAQRKAREEGKGLWGEGGF